MRRLTFAFGLAAFAFAATATAATYTVTSTSDSGAGSLRQAITDANASAGVDDMIAFNVAGAGCDGGGVCTITLASQLPSVSDTVLIDGYTQPGSAVNTNAQGAINAVLKIVVSGASIQGSQGLIVNAADSTVRGLVFNGGFSYTIRLAAANTAVRGCFIGTNAAGSAVVGNGRGVYCNGLGGSFTVGGSAPADRNLLSGNGAQDVWAENASNVTIQGNLIGTDASGEVPLPITGGIVLSPVRAGGVIRDNVVAAAAFSGITIGSGSDVEFGTVVEGNFVGTDVTGTIDLGNTGNGIHVFTSQVKVGGIGPGEGNVVAFNRSSGVNVGYGAGGTSKRENPIRGNSIYSNGIGGGSGNPGIDLVSASGTGFTPNDPGDGDLGGNDLQNFPLIASAVSAGGDTTIEGTFNSTPSTSFAIDFYSNSACIGRPQGFLEGRTYLGSTDVATDGAGNADIDVVLDGVTLAASDVISATATDPDGNTSEFSQRIVISSSPGSGSANGANVILSGFNFLPGATVTVGGLPATNVVVVNFNQITATTPARPPGSLNNITVANTDGSAGTLPNGWIADFLDVPGGHQFYSFVTTLVRNAITVGVGSGNFGVGQNTLRQQMAVFLLKAKNGVCYTPPPCTAQIFADVPCSLGFAPWINELVAQGITTGCGGGNFCPINPVNRQQMAVFLLKTLEGSTYAPPACTVATFADVPCESNFAPWIYELVDRTITAGCGGGNYCPLTTATRGQMATLLVKTFGLQ